MYKIFLVEDEVVIRKGIVNSIPWEREGLELVGEAGDGEVAYPLIIKEKPDILITDIRMPFMDGLELSRLVKKELPRIKVIILSGYDEFKYARTAIGLGVTDYLLKPVNAAQLLEAVRKVTGLIEQEKETAELLLRYQKEQEENADREKNRLFQELVTGGKPVQELLEKAAELMIPLSSAWYNIVLLKTSSIHHTDAEYSPSVVKVMQILADGTDASECIVFDRGLEGKALLFQADTEEELEQVQKKTLGRVRDILAGYPQIRYFGGIGRPVSRISALPESFAKAGKGFAHRFFVDENMFADSDRLSPVRTDRDDAGIDLSRVTGRQLDRTGIRSFLRVGDLQEADFFVEEYFHGLSPSAMKSGMFRQYIVMDAYFCTADFMEELQCPREAVEQPGDFRSEEEAMRYVIRIMEEAVKQRERVSGNKYRNVVEDSLAYIAENYANEELTLNALASYVNFSPNHFSMIFSQQTGQTFIRYLTDFRMNKAKELLRCTSKKSSEISAEVGYRDSHYFSYLFKKTQGMTPTQYRNSESK